MISHGIQRLSIQKVATRHWSHANLFSKRLSQNLQGDQKGVLYRFEKHRKEVHTKQEGMEWIINSSVHAAQNPESPNSKKSGRPHPCRSIRLTGEPRYREWLRKTVVTQIPGIEEQASWVDLRISLTFSSSNTVVQGAIYTSRRSC